MQDIAETNTVVIGAGAAGLATAACLDRAGIPCVVIEASAGVAAPWRHHYDRLHLNSSRAMSGLPHFPLPRRLPRFPSREQMIAYFEEYARTLGIVPRFSEPVTSIARARAGDRWETTTSRAVYRSTHVVVATGRLHRPHRPQWPGSERFGGPILHSSEYRNGGLFAGQRVLVVGLGNSGAEIALDLLEHGAQPVLAVRSPVNVVPREWLGVPIDVWAWILDRFPSAVGDVVGRAIGRLRFGPLASLGLRPLPFGPVTGMRQHRVVPTIDSGTLARLRRGEIGLIAGGLTGFSTGEVSFSDGITRPFDAVVLATGFRPALGALLGAGTEGVLDQEGNPRDSGCAVVPGLYFCGYRVSLTGVLRRIAHEARSIGRDIARAPARVVPVAADAEAKATATNLDVVIDDLLVE